MCIVARYDGFTKLRHVFVRFTLYIMMCILPSQISLIIIIVIIVQENFGSAVNTVPCLYDISRGTIDEEENEVGEREKEQTI